MRPAGIRDVAALAGVSVSTVSSALNSPDRVSERSARVVAEAARALGYVPNRAARALRTGGVRTIAFAFPDLSSPLAAEIALGALGAAAGAGHLALTADGAGNPSSGGTPWSSSSLTGRTGCSWTRASIRLRHSIGSSPAAPPW